MGLLRKLCQRVHSEAGRWRPWSNEFRHGGAGWSLAERRSTHADFIPHGRRRGAGAKAALLNFSSWGCCKSGGRLRRRLRFLKGWPCGFGTFQNKSGSWRTFTPRISMKGRCGGALSTSPSRHYRRESASADYPSMDMGHGNERPLHWRSIHKAFFSRRSKALRPIAVAVYCIPFCRRCQRKKGARLMPCSFSICRMRITSRRTWPSASAGADSDPWRPPRCA